MLEKATGGEFIIRRCSGSALCCVWQRSQFMCGPMICLGDRPSNDAVSGTELLIAVSADSKTGPLVGNKKNSGNRSKQNSNLRPHMLVCCTDHADDLLNPPCLNSLRALAPRWGCLFR
jgi:hypothetical protein